MTKLIILDRYEGDYAIIEIDGKIKKEPISRLTKKVKEGTFLTFNGVMYAPDGAATELRKSQIAALEEDLFN